MSVQVTKVWWEGEKMMAEPIPESEIYEPIPVAWFYAGSKDEPMSVALDKDLDEAQKANCLPLYFGNPV